MKTRPQVIESWRTGLAYVAYLRRHFKPLPEYEAKGWGRWLYLTRNRLRTYHTKLEPRLNGEELLADIEWFSIRTFNAWSEIALEKGLVSYSAFRFQFTMNRKLKILLD